MLCAAGLMPDYLPTSPWKLDYHGNRGNYINVSTDETLEIHVSRHDFKVTFTV